MKNPHDQKNMILKHAWELFGQYDLNSAVQQSLHRKVQSYILLLGVIVTILVITQTFIKTPLEQNHLLASLKPWLDNLKPWLQNSIIIIPIAISTLVALATFFRFGIKWVNLRTAAETLKSEIYQYRTAVGKYNTELIPQNQPLTKPEDTLFKQIQTISEQLMSTEAAQTSLKKYEGQIPPEMFGADLSQDDGYSTLASDSYVNVRLDTQISYYQKRTKKLYNNLQILHVLILVGGGVGTFLAAIGLELWVVLTSTLVSVFTIYLQYNQVESTLLKYNKALNDLNNIKVWWASLSDNERNEKKNMDKLVTSTEQILLTEHQIWVQNMKQAISKIQEEQEKKAKQAISKIQEQEKKETGK